MDFVLKITQKMYFSLIFSTIFSVFVFHNGIYGYENEYIFGNEQVAGYHFHTYYFQSNPKSSLEAETLLNKTQDMIDREYLYGCINSRMYNDPAALHPVGNFITCCNSTSMFRALPWFMNNHGNLSVLLHPLTKKAFSDHTQRAMFLGQVVPLDFTFMPVPDNLTSVFRCVIEDLPTRSGVPIWV